MEKKGIITKICDVFCKVEKTIAWILFAVMLALLLLEVFYRYVLNVPVAWAEEMVRYVYISVSYIGAIIAVRERSHIQIDILPSIMKKLIKNEKRCNIVLQAIELLTDAIQTAFFAILTWWMIAYNMDVCAKGQITTANQWPMWLMCLPVTVSLGLMSFHALLNFFEVVTSLIKGGKAGANA